MAGRKKYGFLSCLSLFLCGGEKVQQTSRTSLSAATAFFFLGAHAAVSFYSLTLQYRYDLHFCDCFCPPACSLPSFFFLFLNPLSQSHPVCLSVPRSLPFFGGLAHCTCAAKDPPSSVLNTLQPKEEKSSYHHHTHHPSVLGSSSSRRRCNPVAIANSARGARHRQRSATAFPTTRTFLARPATTVFSIFRCPGGGARYTGGGESNSSPATAEITAATSDQAAMAIFSNGSAGRTSKRTTPRGSGNLFVVSKRPPRGLSFFLRTPTQDFFAHDKARARLAHLKKSEFLLCLRGLPKRVFRLSADGEPSLPKRVNSRSITLSLRYPTALEPYT